MRGAHDPVPSLAAVHEAAIRHRCGHSSSHAVTQLEGATVCHEGVSKASDSEKKGAEESGAKQVRTWDRRLGADVRQPIFRALNALMLRPSF